MSIAGEPKFPASRHKDRNNCRRYDRAARQLSVRRAGTYASGRPQGEHGRR